MPGAEYGFTGSRIRQFLHPHGGPLHITKISPHSFSPAGARNPGKNSPPFELPDGPGGLWSDSVAPPQKAGARINGDVSTWHAIVFHRNFLSLVVTMETGNSTRDGPNRLEAKVQELINSRLSARRVRQRAGRLLASRDLLQVVQALTPEEQGRFVDRVDQVRRLGCLSIISANVPLFTGKAYPTVETRNAALLTALGEVCSAIGKLPASTTVSVGLRKTGNGAIASGGLRDVWPGEYGGKRVAIGVFRIYSGEKLSEAKKVRIHWPIRIGPSKTNFTDLMETGSNVEEVRPPKYHRISRSGYEAL